MKRLMAGLLFASVLGAGTAVAQYEPFNEAGVTMGHWHIASHDVEANKKMFAAMGGIPRGGRPEPVQFPGHRVNLALGGERGSGGSVGSVVDHVGFIVKDVQESVAKWKAAGIPVLPGNNGRLDQAYVVTPEGVRIEILEDKTQPMPIRHEHIHFAVPKADLAKAQGWYVKTFGGKPGTRNGDPVVDIPGAQLRFRGMDKAQAPTRGRALDHIGFDIKDMQAFTKKLQAEGIKLDEPIRNGQNGVKITYITDPWGTRIELVQQP